ncbi:hypothetical protein [Burkholderia gladioli]|uniref:hypothetical protein n=1 Tax=Burkholderia gladioli TaxID=28095 RepID=UPI00164143D5|nr:hypothetical protein [Burkholderia gladioli]
MTETEQLAEARKLIAHASEYAISALGNDWHERATALLALRAPAISETGWQPIETAPEGELVVVFWLDPNAAVELECYDFDMLEDGSWRQWTDHYEWAHSVAPVTEVPCTMPREHPPYTHWKRLGTPTEPAPAISESEWQPIETAPASGKYLVKGGYLKVPGTNHWHWPKAEVRIQRVNHYFYVEDAVYNHPNGSGVSTLIYEPKHWKPLPFDEAIDAARKGEKS